MEHPNTLRPPNLAARLLGCGFAAMALTVTPLHAAQTDISSTPITSANSAQVKPNIMLLMDTSGSMGWGHMPDEVETQVGINAVGYKAAQCNVLYYNPFTSYQLPKLASGAFFPAPNFNGGLYDAYDSTSIVPPVDLSSLFKAYDDLTLRTSGYNDTPQPAYYYWHTGGGAIANYTATTCTDGDTGATRVASDGGTWTRRIVSSNSGPGATDERVNFTVWYNYYRTRISLIKSAASLAFTPLTDSFRVGFITMKPKDLPTDASINQAKYLAIADFDTTQRGLWFDKLFSQKPGGSSPAREGLARVGRHYAGKQDGINSGMAGDPVQYSCQQNFTIMTTDGYWNDQAETPGAGPVQIDGTTLVGQQDGTLTVASGNSPRPIWDGVPDGQQVITNKSNAYGYSPCGVYFNRTDTQISRATSQTTVSTSQTTQSTGQNLQSTTQMLRTSLQDLQSTAQTVQSTLQNRQSTNQNLKSTNQNLQSTTQTKISTVQNLQNTNQNLKSTNQNLQATSQTVSTQTWVEQTVRINRQSTTQTLKSTSQTVKNTLQTRTATKQNRRSTVQTLKSTNQNLQSTTQVTQSTLQNLRNTVQNLTSTAQMLQSTAQVRRSTSQTLTSTYQELQSTSQVNLSTSQVRQSTSQLRSCSAASETCTPVPVGSCSATADITCETVTTGPTLVASCTAATANAGNNYVATTCAVTNTGPTPVLSCTPAGASAGNSFTTTTCNTVTTSTVPVGVCNAAPANIGNAYTATTCSSNSTGPTPTATCTPAAGVAGNAYVATSCSFPTSGPTPVASCTAAAASAGNSWTATTCTPNNTTNVPVSSCTAAVASAGNSWTDTTCTPNNTTNVPTATCSVSAGTAANSWTTTSCSNGNTTNVPVAACVASAANAGNGWTTTSCPAPATTGPFGVSSCVGVAAAAGNSWTATICGSNNTTNVPIGVCAASGPTAGNSWTTTTCPAPVTTGPAGAAACGGAAAAAGNAWTTTTCTPNNFPNVPVLSCVASAAAAGNGWTTTTCPAPVTTGPTPNDPVGAPCSVTAASAGNGWTSTSCPDVIGTNVPVAACGVTAAAAGNAWTSISCPGNVNTGPTGVSACAASGPTAGNFWTTTTCTPNNFPNVAVTSCVASAAAAGNSWTTTTCPAPTILSGPTAVSTCTAAAGNAGNGYQETFCQSMSATIPSGTCVASGPTAGNGWQTTTCNVLVVSAFPVLTCTPQVGNAGNGWLTITCPAPNVTANVPVLSCIAAAAAAFNSWTTTTCPAPVVTTNVPVATCTAAAPIAGNSWTRTTCPAPITTGPTAVSSCSPIVASAGNSWTTTNCTSINTTNVPVLTCTPSAASAGNSWTDTTCPAANVTTNLPVLACAAAAAVAGNFWTSTTCPAPVVTTNVPVATCTAAAAIAGNSWTSTTCPAPITTGPTYLAVCTPVAAAAGNSWTATICTPNNTTNVPVASCTASAASVGNNWMATTCTPNNSLSVPVSSCIAQAPAAGNGYTTVNCTPNNTTNVPVATCSNSVATGANNWVATTCTTNNTTNVPVSSCTPIAPTAGNGYMTTTCPVLTSGPTGASSCVASGPSAGNGYTTTTCASTNTGPTPIAACTPVPATAANGWAATSCPTIVTGPTVVATCTAAVPNLGNNFTRTDCAALSGKKIQYVTTTTVDTTFFSGGLPTGSLPTVTTTGSPTDLDGVCYAPNVVPPALPVPNPQAPSWTAADATTYPSCSGWPCSESTALGGARSVNSLADVAQYYYVTDLRPATTWPPNISTDDVPAVGSGPEDDRVRWQHMTTFSIALGVSGTLTYRPDYKSGSAVTGDFAAIRVGSKNWPLWPDPALENPAACPACYANDKNLWNNPRAIDDFWHAAVNGRGTYFSAGNPTSVIAGLADALAGISARLASASGAGTSNLEPVPGDNLIYLAQYTTSKWTGDVQAKEIDLATGAVLPTVIWSAQAQLDARTNLACDTRSIYLFRQGAANNLVNFTWNTSACDVSGLPTGAPSTGLNATEQAHFGPPNSDLLSQVPSMTDGTLATADQRTPAKNANLLNFLRGQRGLEDFTSNDATRLFRKRDHVLGDTVDGQPIYVRAPFASYGDAGYGAFKLANAGRTPMLYVPANDGMLHAFYAGANKTDPLGGKEAWAIVPSTVLPNLYKLADDNYKNNHAFFVDGTPAVTDFFDSVSGTWKTILVAGLNDGGKGYYAIDITDPLAPKGLWEFKTNPAVCPANAAGVGGVVAAAAGNTSDCHLGYTFGKPITSKLADGTWVVMVSSGYNNVNAPALTGDGEGYLYVLNASTGQILYKIGTGVGTATTPSGLAQLNNYVDKPETSNLTVRLYGTDVLGNIWRFDVNDNTAPAGREATRVGTAKDAGGTAQPITTRPEISQLNGQPMLFVATGRLLGASDVGDVQVQSIYGIVDPLVGSPSFANLRSALAPLGITQVGSGAGAYRTVACTGSTLQCGSGVGWVVNLPDIGERVNVEMKFRQGTLVVGSNVPQISACTSGGYSWLNYLDFQSGLAVTGGAAGTVSEQVANSLIVGLTLIKLPDGTVKAIVTTSDANIYLGSPSFKPTGIKGGRISWREIAAP